MAPRDRDDGESRPKGPEPPAIGWRFRLGTTLFVLGFASPALIPVVAWSDLSTAWKTALSGALAAGVPEVMMLVAAAVMGKEGFGELKRRLGRILGRYAPPKTVGRTRYRIGLAMFSLPVLLGWLGPYLHGLLPRYDSHALFWHVGGDLVFLASFFVLGGEFWGKIRALFIHGAKVVVPATEGPITREAP